MLSFGDADRLACYAPILSWFFGSISEVISLRFGLSSHLSRRETEEPDSVCAAADLS